MPYCKAERHEGFTLFEVAVSISILLIGLTSLAGVFITIRHQRQEQATRRVVLQAATDILEEIKGVAPEWIATGYNGMKVSLEGVYGTGTNSTALSVTVDSSNPALLIVTVTGGWTSNGRDHSLDLQSEIFNPKG